MDLSSPLVPIGEFALDPAGLYVNHGSFGACPRAVVAAQDATRARLEAAPMRFMVLEWQAALDAARACVAGFVGADPEDVVLVPNATTGIATVLAARPWAPGDRLVVTDHGYRACSNAAHRLAETRGVEVVTVVLGASIDRADVVTRRIAEACDDRTKLVLIDHVTSPTAIILDVAGVAAALAPRGIDVVVDGAHAPGQLDLDVTRTGAAYYVANCHKWMCAPKGSGLLWARRDRRDALRPLVTSHGETAGVGPANRFHARFDWNGTHDPSAHLATPVAIDTIAALGGGWPAVRARNHALALAARDLVAARLGCPSRAADAHTGELTGAMVSLEVALPPGATALALERELLVAGIESWLADFGGGVRLRLSAHVYNRLGDYDRLADALWARGVRGPRPPP